MTNMNVIERVKENGCIGIKRAFPPTCSSVSERARERVTSDVVRLLFTCGPTSPEWRGRRHKQRRRWCGRRKRLKCGQEGGL